MLQGRSVMSHGHTMLLLLFDTSQNGREYHEIQKTEYFEERSISISKDFELPSVCRSI